MRIPRWPTALLLCAFAAACGGERTDDTAAADDMALAIAHNTLGADEEAAGWILLFDGHSSDGWRGYGRDDLPPGSWKAEDGELAGLSSDGNMDGGDAITVAELLCVVR